MMSNAENRTLRERLAAARAELADLRDINAALVGERNAANAECRPLRTENARFEAMESRAFDLRGNTKSGGGEFEHGLHVAASSILGLPSERRADAPTPS